MEIPSAYIPMDRRQALARGESLPDRTRGTALYADISGFTPLTEELVRSLGPQRGAEELTRHLNAVYDALITELHNYAGSVVSFNGDAILCWFDGDDGARATACALAMQKAMEQFTNVSIPSGGSVSLGMKTSVASGPARRFLVGNPQIQIRDVLAGAILDRLAATDHQTERGEVVLDASTVALLRQKVKIASWRLDDRTGQRYSLVDSLVLPVEATPWPPIPPQAVSDDQIRLWLMPPVYERLASGQGEFLAELRPAVALFLHFGGIDYDADAQAGAKLDEFVGLVQRILLKYDACLLHVSIGDKGSHLSAAFGAPLAHEDDAARAVSAALELRTEIPSLKFITHIQIGISQGRMRTGAYGGAMSRTYGVLGDDVNLAARLMQAAAPGQIMVSKVVHQATGDNFMWEDLPDIRVKGKAEPVSIFGLTGSKQRRATRLQAPRYALPMVGRTSELALIQSKIQLVLKGQGQIIGVTAEAGMGKSRLVAEAIGVARDWQLIGYDGECQSYGTNTDYLVWRSIWQQFFDLDVSAPLEEQARLLSAQLAAIDAALVPRLPLLGPVLNIPLPDNDLTRSFDAKLRKSSLEALLVDCVRARAKRTPLLLVLEDCHWLDPLSHDLLEVIGRAIATLPVLLMMAYRPPELERLQAPRVSQLPHFTEVRLTEFTPQEAERLIHLKLERFFGAHVDAPRALIERTTARAQGNPFYVEELLNYYQDRGIDPHDVHALEQLDLPTSLHSLILSRVDQLTESQKITLKLASVIGRLFRAAMLWGAYSQLGDAQRVKSDLALLNRLDLMVLEGEPELTYLFKHIITQEVAYESLPYATRALLHDQIAQYIERVYAGALEQYVDLLAYHYGRSENEAKKREYFLRAGEAAQAHYSNAAAIDYYERVLPLVPGDQQISVRLRLGQVLELVGRWTDAVEAYQRALDQAEQLGDRQAQARCHTAAGELFRKRSHYDEASHRLERAREIFEELNDAAGVGQVLHYAGSLSAHRGDLAAARTLYELSLSIRRELGDQPQIASLLSNLAIVARSQGNYSLARTLTEESLEIRRTLGDRRGIAVSLNNLGNVALDQEDYTGARAHLEEAVALQREVGDRSYIANALDNLGNVARAQGDYAAARALYAESLTISHEVGEKWLMAYLFEDMGCLAATLKQPERALRLVGAASALREAIGAPLTAVERDKLERLLAPARHNLDEAAQSAALTTGKSLTLEEATAFALEPLN